MTNEIDRYLQQVLRQVHAPAAERARFEADLRAHIQAAVEAGEPLPTVLRRLGSPAEVAAGFMGQLPLNYAGFGLRLAAFAVDFVVMMVAAMAVLLLAGLISALFPLHPTTTLDLVLGGVIALIELSLGLTLLGIILLYFPLQEARFGRTIGKRVLGLYVLTESGMTIGFKEAFLRRLSFYFDFMPVDALFVLFTAKKQRAFDIIARTVVVSERAAEDSERAAQAALPRPAA